MSKKWAGIPKGRACGLNLSPEYQEGYKARVEGVLNSANPYDFFDEYEKSYAWDMGWQEGKR
jgi:hypothetical protein